MSEENAMRKDFPILKRLVHEKPLAYLDNAATTQKPSVVIDAMSNYYTQHNANVSRGVHTLADESTTVYETARKTLAEFFGVSAHQFIFTAGTTDSINFVAHSLAPSITADDEILVSQMEHHANFIPWQELAKQTGAKLKIIGLTEELELDMNDFIQKLSDKTKIICLTHASNVTGTVTPIQEVVSLAKEHGALVMVDGAQAAGHMPVNVDELGVDFYAAGAHKMYGPQGIGALIVEGSAIKYLRPFRLGGGAVATVSNEEYTLLDAPHCFEAGTPNVAGAAGFEAAAKYLQDNNLAKLQSHDRDLAIYAWDALAKNSSVKLFGKNPENSSKRAAIISFTVSGVHPHDVAQVLDDHGVAIRSGTHCAEPLHKHIGEIALSRVSFACYNTKADVDQMINALQDAIQLFGGESHE